MEVITFDYMKTNGILWLIYALLVVVAIIFNGDEHPFISSGPSPAGKYIAWIAFAGFTAYSYYCSQRENLFKTINSMKGLHWGRQIGLDLYIGITLFMIFVFFHQDSILVPLLWLLPALAFVNLSSLLYVALHYDSLISLLAA